MEKSNSVIVITRNKKTGRANFLKFYKDLLAHRIDNTSRLRPFSI